MKLDISPGTVCVYILLCEDGSLSTGWTNDFNKRFAAHQNGSGAKYTRSHKPLKPVYIEILPDKIAATQREAAIKKLRSHQKRHLVSSARNQIDSLIFADAELPVSE